MEIRVELKRNETKDKLETNEKKKKCVGEEPTEGNRDSDEGNEEHQE